MGKVTCLRGQASSFISIALVQTQWRLARTNDSIYAISTQKLGIFRIRANKKPFILGDKTGETRLTATTTTMAHVICDRGAVCQNNEDDRDVARFC